MTALEFWYEFASTYSYPAAMRVEALCKDAGVELKWRPFLLGPIFAAQGWNDSPFNVYPVKGRYMWRDMERICAGQGIPLKRQSQFPRGSILGARIALIAADEGWAGAFSRAVYTANFAEDRDISRSDVIASTLAALGHDADKLMAQATAPENKQALKDNVDEAVARGIFGAPTMFVGDEMFWGNDRLEDAIRWATG